jgi:hypothetical protein
MDILYITPEIKQEMLKYCEQELIDFVFDNFVEQGGNIIIKKDGPSRWWIITDYIKNTSIEKFQKLAVILSFSAVAGIVQIGEFQSCGDTSILLLLKKLNLINEEESNMFAEFFYNIRQGKDVKFMVK